MAGGTSGISPSFPGLSRFTGHDTPVLLTRSRLCPRPKPGSSLHLHVLSTPPAFVLSQDQTLRENFAWYQPATGRSRWRFHCLMKSVESLALAAYTMRRANSTGLVEPSPMPKARVRVEPGRDWKPRVGSRSHMLLSFQRPPRPRTGIPSYGAPGEEKGLSDERPAVSSGCDGSV